MPVLCCLGLMLITPASLAARQGNSPSFQRYAALNSQMEEANRAVDAHQFEAAVRILDDCLKQIPDHFEAQFLLARIAYERGDYQTALAKVVGAERSLTTLDLQYRREQGALRARDAQEEQDLRSSLENLYARGVGQEHGCSDNFITVKQNALDNLEEKKGHLYERQSPFAIPAAYRFLHGNCLNRLERKPEAIAQFRLAIKADSTSAGAWNNLIALLLEQGDRAQARIELALAESAHVTIQGPLRAAVLESEEEGSH